MKNLNEIRTIITNLPDEIFERINNADYDTWDLDSRVAKNGKKRLKYNLKKIGLTEAEWELWCND